MHKLMAINTKKFEFLVQIFATNSDNNNQNIDGKLSSGIQLIKIHSNPSPKKAL